MTESEGARVDHDEKFKGLNEAIKEARAKEATAIIVPSPRALGDDYKELVRNLDMIAAAGLALQIVPEGRDRNQTDRS